MFNRLSDALSKIINNLRGRTILTEQDISTSLREIRIALLEADVALPVVKEMLEAIKIKALGADVIKNVAPGHMMVKIVQDHIEEILGSDTECGLVLSSSQPTHILMVGLQGAGKTTTSAKLALKLSSQLKRKPLLVSLDIKRPAAQEQLAVLAEQVGIASLPLVKEQAIETIVRRALELVRQEGFDTVIFDSAGRLHTNQELMDELSQLKYLIQPKETLLVVDSLTGQDAVNLAHIFNQKLAITGTILTRIDGDARGGAALTMRAITKCPIKFLGTGEKLTDLEEYHPSRIASRILGMGDIVSMVEKAQDAISEQEAEKMAVRLQKGIFTFDDLASQIKTLKKMGGIAGIMSFMPGMGKIKSMVGDTEKGEKNLLRQLAIINSMTKKEKKDVNLLNASRKRRIASGAGVHVQDVNKLVKQYQEMSLVIKKISKMDKTALIRGPLSKIFS
jgi:signal recognition particle subunit SRP54